MAQINWPYYRVHIVVINILNSQIKGIISFIATIIFIFTLSISCSTVSGKHILISALQVEANAVYPNSEIELVCKTDENDTKIEYYWFCEDGSFTLIEGNKAIWQSPNKYGQFEIKVRVVDSNDLVDEVSTTVYVVANKNKPLCSSCGN